MTTPTTPNPTHTNSPIKKTTLPTVSPRSSSNDVQHYVKFSSFRKRYIVLCMLIPLWLIYAIKQYHLNNNNEAIAAVNRYIREKALLLEQEYLKEQEKQEQQQLLLNQQQPQQDVPHVVHHDTHILITKKISTTTTISSQLLRGSDTIKNIKPESQQNQPTTSQQETSEVNEQLLFDNESYAHNTTQV